MTVEHPPEPDKQATDEELFTAMTPYQQQQTLHTRRDAARAVLEEVAQGVESPLSQGVSYEDARASKAAADQAVLDFEAVHGTISPPDQ